MRKIRLLPPFLTLLSGAITILILTIKKTALQEKLLILFLVMLGFAIAGSILRSVLEKALVIEEEKVSDEGAVVEKPVEEAEGEAAEAEQIAQK